MDDDQISIKGMLLEMEFNQYEKQKPILELLYFFNMCLVYQLALYTSTASLLRHDMTLLSTLSDVTINGMRECTAMCEHGRAIKDSIYFRLKSFHYNLELR